MDAAAVLHVEVHVDDADGAELDAEAVSLREELLELDVDAVDRPSGGAAPDGTRSGQAALTTTLLVGLGQAAIAAVVRQIEAWVARRRGRSVKLTVDGDTIELSNVSADDQRRLLEVFLARHTGTGD